MRKFSKNFTVKLSLIGSTEYAPRENAHRLHSCEDIESGILWLNLICVQKEVSTKQKAVVIHYRRQAFCINEHRHTDTHGPKIVCNILAFYYLDIEYAKLQAPHLYIHSDTLIQAHMQRQ